MYVRVTTLLNEEVDKSFPDVVSGTPISGDRTSHSLRSSNSVFEIEYFPEARLGRRTHLFVNLPLRTLGSRELAFNST